MTTVVCWTKDIIKPRTTFLSNNTGEKYQESYFFLLYVCFLLIWIYFFLFLLFSFFSFCFPICGSITSFRFDISQQLKLSFWLAIGVWVWTVSWATGGFWSISFTFNTGIFLITGVIWRIWLSNCKKEKKNIIYKNKWNLSIPLCLVIHIFTC